MKLNSYPDKDKTHLRDMIEVGVIDGDWPKRFPPVLAEGLQLLLDDPLCKHAYRDEDVGGALRLADIVAIESRWASSITSTLRTSNRV